MGRGAFIISNMQQSKAEDRYSCETLLSMNTLYDHEHHLTQADVDAANALVRHIERTRNPRVPQVGDRVRYTTRHGDFHGNALIEAVREDGTRSICLCPYVPFVWMTAGGIGCAVSGGPFTAVMPQELKPSGAVPGDFCAWGHCGACGNGVVRFCAEVPLWEYREPESLYGDFSTEKWRKISLYKDTECRSSDLYRGDCISFRTEKEFQMFLSDYEGTAFAAPYPKSVIVWCYRDEQTAVSQEKWDALDAPVTERRIYNAPQPVKLVKDHGRHTTVCYFVRPEFSYKKLVIRSVIASRQGRLGTYSADATDRERLADTDGLAYEEYYESPLTIRYDGLYRNVISLEFCEDGLTPVCLMNGGDDFPLPLENLSCDTLQGIVEWLDPTRYDVFRLGELQNFLDGHESPEFGLNRDEAAAERDRLQLRIYAEAITAFMKRQSAALPGNVSLRDYAEALVDIAYEAGRRKFRPSDNSRDTAATLIAWGDEFSRQHEDTDWTEKEFLDEIYRFTAEKLQSVPNKDDPNAEFDIAFLNRAVLERHGYDTATITDSDLQELAGRMGDYYCESSKFSEDLRTACGDFGLKLRDTTNPK